MTSPLFDLLDASWPAAARHRAGGFCIRDGQGGGKRASAATAVTAWTPADLALAVAAMTALRQPALFMIRPGEDALDAALAADGYAPCDPTLIYGAPVAGLGPAPAPMEAFAHWPPLAIVGAIWAEGGIGPARRAVMDRCALPRTAILGRTRDRPSGAAFVAADGDTAMLHALEVPAGLRRQGSGAILVRAAAAWADMQGARLLTLAVTAANDGARSLYASLGMEVVGQYHYRMK